MAERIEQLHDETGEIDIMPRTKTEAITDGNENELDDVLVGINGSIEKVAKIVSNPNLLDNPWFTVNQRGATTWITGYGADRWLASGSITVSTNGVSVANSAILIERFEKGIVNIGDTITVSLKKQDGTIISNSIALTSSSDQTIINENGIKVDYAIRDDFDAILITNSTESALLLRAVKLEFGLISTLANDTVPNYAEELLKCQRYFQSFTGTAYFNGYSDTSSSGFILVDLPVTMRSSPSVILYSTSGQAFMKGNVYTVTNLTLNYFRNNFTHYMLNFSTSSSIPTREAIGGINLTFALSADL